MKPGEIYDSKRNNFISKTKRLFDFLISEFDFEEPNYTFYKQPNGTITMDKFIYEGKNRSIIISNAYHPNDYGFEINLTDKRTERMEMVHHMVKEKQDMEQSYLEHAAQLLNKMLIDNNEKQ